VKRCTDAERKTKMTMSEPINVLIVDDNEDLLKTLTLILKRHGFNVETAANGLSAMDMFRRGEFDVTLMDVIMPEMNGVEVLHHIHEIDPEARVILMTACSEEDLMAAALKEGAYCVVHKPLRIDQTIEMIKEARLYSPIMRVGDDPEIIETVVRMAGKNSSRVIPSALHEDAVRL
jgi:DNA-binding NtrC family response regulator